MQANEWAVNAKKNSWRIKSEQKSAAVISTPCRFNRKWNEISKKIAGDGIVHCRLEKSEQFRDLPTVHSAIYSPTLPDCFNSEIPRRLDDFLAFGCYLHSIRSAIRGKCFTIFFYDKLLARFSDGFVVEFDESLERSNFRPTRRPWHKMRQKIEE